MPDVVHFLSILNKHDESAAKVVWSKIKNNKTRIKNCKFTTIKEKEVVDIAELLEMLLSKHIPYTHQFRPKEADPFRDDIIATFTAFENGDTSMINAPCSAPSVVIDATNHKAADNTSSMETADVFWLYALNSDAPSSPFSTSSVADSLESA